MFRTHRNHSEATRGRREDILRAVIAEADRRRDGVLPFGLPGVADAFGDEAALLAALQMRWHTRLSGRIEAALMDQPDDLEHAVLLGWRSAAADLAGVRAILDESAARPPSEEIATMLDRARRKDWFLLAAMAGRAGTPGPPAVREGRRLEESARAAYNPARVRG